MAQLTQGELQKLSEQDQCNQMRDDEFESKIGDLTDKNLTYNAPEQTNLDELTFMGVEPEQKQINEAAQNFLKTNKFFEELWCAYKKKHAELLKVLDLIKGVKPIVKLFEGLKDNGVIYVPIKADCPSNIMPVPMAPQLGVQPPAQQQAGYWKPSIEYLLNLINAQYNRNLYGPDNEKSRKETKKILGDHQKDLLEELYSKQGGKINNEMKELLQKGSQEYLESMTAEFTKLNNEDNKTNIRKFLSVGDDKRYDELLEGLDGGFITPEVKINPADLTYDKVKFQDDLKALQRSANSGGAVVDKPVDARDTSYSSKDLNYPIKDHVKGYRGKILSIEKHDSLSEDLKQQLVDKGASRNKIIFEEMFNPKQNIGVNEYLTTNTNPFVGGSKKNNLKSKKLNRFNKVISTMKKTKTNNLKSKRVRSHRLNRFLK